MSAQYGDIDEHIERLKNGGTLTENEVKNLCEKVRGRFIFLLLIIIAGSGNFAVVYFVIPPLASISTLPHGIVVRE